MCGVWCDGFRVAVARFASLLCAAVWLLAASGAAAQTMRGVSLVEDRIALVIGNAAYKRDALDNPVNDARLIARTLEKATFQVTLRENLDRAGMFNALREFGARLNENTVAVLYYAGHALQLREQNFMIPIDAEIRSEDEIPVQGIDLSYILAQMSRAKSRVNVVILDACRDNPFAKRSSGVVLQGLAQMDAPVGTFLAYATAPGKQAPDGIGPQRGNSLYTAQLAKNMLTPGLPVELMFKRVREAVVRESNQMQVPWEHSSLVGEFAFVPGINASNDVAEAPDDNAELALWASVQRGGRADDFRAYLRQYPKGRFADAARGRVAELSAPVASTDARTPLMPKVGDTWRYRVTDQFRFGDLFVTARVDAVSDDRVAETWTTTADAKVRTTLVPLRAAFNPLPDWSAAPPEFAPYLQASATPPGTAIGLQQRSIDAVSMTLKPSWQGEEEVVVGAGRFRARKLVLSGHAANARGRGSLRAEYVVWYAPDVRRIVKYQVSAYAGSALREATTFELTEYRLQ